jgi:hypothetical protein
MEITKQDYFIFFASLTAFMYFFFVVAPTPVYFDNVSSNILPRSALYEKETGRWIIGWKRSSIVITTPLVCILWAILIAFGDDVPRLREMDLKSKARQNIRKKIDDGLKELNDFRQRKR